MHQYKLNLLCPISASSGSSTNIFTISGVMSEGTEEFVSWRRLNLVIYCSNDRSSDFSGIDLVMETIYGGNYLCLLLVRVFAVPCLEKIDLYSLSCRCTIDVV